MRNLDDILSLITGNASPEQRKEVFSILKEEPETKEFYRKAKVTWALTSSTRKMSDYKVEKSYQKLHTRISKRQDSRIIIPIYVRYAAVILLLIGIPSTMFFWGRQNSGVSVTEVRYTSVVADKGQIAKVVLPDSSVVWLNSETTITYDNNFAQNNRNLSLRGQAFLEVKKNKNLPLVVASGNLQVKVLGTRFDVKAYPEDNNIKVTLESGKVELLNSTDKSFDYKMKPGQIACYDPESNNVEIKAIKAENYTNWKDGRLVFVDAPVSEVIKSLKRKFDIDIEIGNPSAYKSVFNANFKNESLKEILDYIQYSCQLKYLIIPAKDNVKTKVILN